MQLMRRSLSIKLEETHQNGLQNVVMVLVSYDSISMHYFNNFYDYSIGTYIS